MSAIFVLSVALSIASEADNGAARDLDLFKKICMEGSAKIPSGDVKSTRLGRLPPSLKASLAHAHFYVEDRDKDPDENMKPSRIINGRYLVINKQSKQKYIAVETRYRAAEKPIQLCTMFTNSLSFEAAVASLDPDFDRSQLESYRFKPRKNSLLIGTTRDWHQRSSLGYVIAVVKVEGRQVALQTQMTATTN